MDVRGIRLCRSCTMILYVLSLTKTDVNTTDEPVLSQSNDHPYKGSHMHCVPARSKTSSDIVIDLT